MKNKGKSPMLRLPISRSWTRAAAYTALMKSLRNGIVGLVALVGAAVAPQKAEAVNVTWGTPYQTIGGNTAMNLQITNDNQGTSYTSANINSLMQLVQLYGMDPTGMTGGKKMSV